ncbi:voltage-gated potassium channel [Aureococcus anophagefferens]|nr:voltage-gated potassium channel [Aureococcus anophagefferens]
MDEASLVVATRGPRLREGAAVAEAKADGARRGRRRRGSGGSAGGAPSSAEGGGDDESAEGKLSSEDGAAAGAEGGGLVKRITRKWKGATREVTAQDYRRAVHQFLDDPSSSQAAAICTFVMVSLIVLSVIVLILKETPPYNRNRPLNKAMNQMEVVFNIIFTTEIMLRLSIAETIWQAADLYIVFDILSVMPYWVGLCFKYKLVVNKRGLRFDRGSGNTKMVKKVKEMFKALRMLRLLKLTRRYDGSIVIVHALRDSSSALAAPFFFLFVAVVMCGTFLFVIEDGKPTERGGEEDKVIFVEKLKEHFQAFSIKRADIEDSFRALDMDGSGSLDYDEFQTALVKMEIKLSSHRMFALWNAIDYDQKGEIRLEEFVNLVFKDQGGAERLLLDDIEDEEEGESPEPEPEPEKPRGTLSTLNSIGRTILYATGRASLQRNAAVTPEGEKGGDDAPPGGAQFPHSSLGMSSVLRGAAHNVTKPRRKSAAKSPAKAAQQKSSSRDGLVIDIDSCLVHETTKGKKRTRDWGDEDAPKAAPKSARKTDVLSSVAGALGWLGGYADTPISLAASNPKRAGSRAWDRYEAYKHAKTRARTQFYALGGWDADFAECVAQGHLAEHHP